MKEVKEYQVWLGYNYNWLTGETEEPVTPQLVGHSQATSFKIACLLMEHTIAIAAIKYSMATDNTIVDDDKFGAWDYDGKTNSNRWLGKYYESEEEAWASFPHGARLTYITQTSNPFFTSN